MKIRSNRVWAVSFLLGLGMSLGSPGAHGDGPGWLHPEQRAILELSARVAPEVIDALDAVGAARVVVILALEDAAGGRHLAPLMEPLGRVALQRAGDEVLSAAGAHFLPIHRLRSMAALTGAADAEGVVALAQHPRVRAVALDLRQRAFLNESLPRIGVPALRAQGLNGAGVTVAVVDTGIDFRHRALKKRRAGEICFCSNDGGGCCPNGGVEQRGPRSAIDRDGHGTHVAGIIASQGRGGAPKGAAPKSRLVAVRVFGDDRSGFASSTMAALDWILTERPEVDIVNLSLGTTKLFKGVCDNKGGGLGALFGATVDALRDRGTLVVASSGNDGSRKKMSMPACLRGAVSVGAGFDANYSLVSTETCTQRNVGPSNVACFSNRPKTLDIIAPGVFITSTALRTGSRGSMGTSQAAPHVAGCAALLVHAFRDATPDELTRAMVDSGVPVADAGGRPFPRLDCAAAAAFLNALP